MGDEEVDSYSDEWDPDFESGDGYEYTESENKGVEVVNPGPTKEIEVPLRWEIRVLGRGT